MIDKKVLEWLSSNKFFEGVSQSDLNRLEPDIFSIEVFEKGEKIVSEGSPIDKLYLLISGKIRISKISYDGKEVEVAIIRNF